MNENLTIYAKMSEPPKSALKTIQAGRLRGMSDINPQWRYKVMTETFGLCGIGWKFTIDKTWLENGCNGEVVANAQVSVYIRDPDTKEWSDAIVGVGGSMLITNEKSGLHTSDEAFKMAVTDAFSTSLKMIGVAAAIYEGRWDGSKYSKADYTEPSNNSTLSPEAERERKSTLEKDPKFIAVRDEVKNYMSEPFIEAAQKEKINKAIEECNIKYLESICTWCKEQMKKGA